MNLNMNDCNEFGLLFNVIPTQGGLLITVVALSTVSLLAKERVCTEMVTVGLILPSFRGAVLQEWRAAA